MQVSKTKTQLKGIHFAESEIIWGDIGGLIEEQSDLNTALAGKSSTSHNHTLAGLSEKSYNSLDDKPSIPASHTQLLDIGTRTHAQLETDISGKANADHNHDLDYADIDHAHELGDVAGLIDALAGKASTAHNHTLAGLSEKSYNSLTDKPAIPSSHTQLSDIGTRTHTQIESDISGKEPAFTKKTAFNKNFGTVSGTVAEGDKGFRITPPYFNNRSKFLGDQFYIGDIYNIFFAADKRFSVSQSNITSFSEERLFLGSYSSASFNKILAGVTGTITINIPGKSELTMILAPAGQIVVSFYYTSYTDQISIELKNNLGETITYTDKTQIATSSSRGIYRFIIPYGGIFNVVEIKISITAGAADVVLSSIEYMINQLDDARYAVFSKQYTESLYYETLWKNSSNIKKAGINPDGHIFLGNRSSDPANPAAGECVFWLSDGTGSGDAGDVMIKINSGGTIKTGTIVDFSAI